MKKIFLFFILVSASFAVNAADLIEGSLSELKKEALVRVFIDYSKTVFDKKYDEKIFINMNGVADKWESQIKPQLVTTFIKSANDKISKKSLVLISGYGTTVDTKYIITICPIKAKLKGDVYAEIVVKNTATNEIVAKVSAAGGGGHWGDFTNLLCDGMEELGEDFGGVLRHGLKKQSTQEKIASESKVSVKVFFDYSKTVFEKDYDEKTFAEENDIVNSWESQIKPQLFNLFMIEANDDLKKTDISLIMGEGSTDDTKYELIIRPTKITKYGNIEAKGEFRNIETNKIIKEFKVTAHGGVFGSLQNLLSDGFKSLGKNTAKYLLYKIDDKGEFIPLDIYKKKAQPKTKE